MGKSGHNARDIVFVASGLINNAVALNDTPPRGECWRNAPTVDRPRGFGVYTDYGCTEYQGKTHRRENC
jgi:hypothetical protein